MTVNVDQVMTETFSGPRDPMSAEYKQGCRAALHFRFNGLRIVNPYQPGTARCDAFIFGTREGHRIFRTYAAEGRINLRFTKG